MTLILDSGGLLAAMDDGQTDHASFLGSLEASRPPRVISPFVVAELDYMISRDYGRESQAAFVEEVDRGAYRLETFDGKDFSRLRELMARYEYLVGFGVADASNVVLAERCDCFDILTTDQRDFRTVAGEGDRYFRILPYDL